MIIPMSLPEMKSLFIRASAMYHNLTGESIISDREYDEIKRNIASAEPEWPPLKQAGWKINQGSPLAVIPHRGFMGSIFNACDYCPSSTPEAHKWEVGMQSWLDRNKLSVMSGLKVDGLSVALQYSNGQLTAALARGDCITGEDLTHHIPFIQAAPTFIAAKDDIMIRGEVVMFNEDWEAFHAAHPDYKNARNAASGIMGSKDVSKSKFLRFVAHDLQILSEVRGTTLSSIETYGDILHWLKEQRFVTALGVLCKTYAQTLTVFKEVEELRNTGKAPYEIDGIVFRINDLERYGELGFDSGRCPRGAVAWKFDTQKAKSIFRGLDVSTGHSGKLTPTALIDPVALGGVTVSRASLSNWELIKTMDLHIGDEVMVERCGDVIPGIIGVTKNNGGAAVIEPANCPVCDYTTGRRELVAKKKGNDEPALSADTFCMNPECPAKSTGRINKWVKDTGMLGVGDAFVEAMVQHEFIADAADLYTLCQPELQEMPFGKSVLGANRAGKIIAAVQGKKCLPLNTFLGALGVRGLGEGIARNVREKMPGEFDTLSDWVGCTKIIDFAEQIGLKNIARSIYDGLCNRMALINKLMTVGVTIAAPAAPVAAAEALTGFMSGKVFCLTGSFDEPKAEIARVIVAAGGQVEDDVRSNVTHVMMNTVPADDKLTGKAKKAKAKGLPLISMEDFRTMIRGISKPPMGIQDEMEGYPV